ncbi:putative family metal ion transporter [Golovinomyces cichoracearum]|uniref:Putative family metal ion transporter n=1 Tax=Golovinomyces cichoracearum TaxID=62708 RepID=A0A420IFV0_9PEZI|nr:putative family metal ion transporter [Golovinomyces cichoracearum]
MSSTVLPAKSESPSNFTFPANNRPTARVIQPLHNLGESLSSVSRSVPTSGAAKKKRKNHRGRKANRPRKPSFTSKDGVDVTNRSENPPSGLDESPQSSIREILCKAHARTRRSIDNEAPSDRKEQTTFRRRRSNAMGQSAFGVPLYESSTSYRMQQSHNKAFDRGNEGITVEEDERSPLIKPWSTSSVGYGVYGLELPLAGRRRDSNRRQSSRSSGTSNPNIAFEKSSPTFSSHFDGYNVNDPPSIPGSPRLETSRVIGFRDVLAMDDFRSTGLSPRDVAGSISEHIRCDQPRVESPQSGVRHIHERPNSLQHEDDIHFREEEYIQEKVKRSFTCGHGPRRRRGKWPDLSILDEWSRFEKEGASNERRAKKITEPQLIGGRLRPIHKGWHRAEDDAPYRFTYFNEQFQSTIHSQTISELVQPGSSFRELFIPDLPVLSDSSETESDSNDPEIDDSFHNESRPSNQPGLSQFYETRCDSKQMESLHRIDSAHFSREHSGAASPTDKKLPDQKGSNSPRSKPEKPKKYGDRPIWWLDVLSPTDAEMKVLSTVFGIHPLTVEDILMQEAREKVELFHNYYFVNYRSFEQDANNEDYLEPVNMYVVVFREGVISFHFSLTPHPANVRRRIRQLKDYLILSSDWISYAIIDDITDVFVPLIQNIEDEVDNIDDAILKLHSPISDSKSKKNDEKYAENFDVVSNENGGDMLRRVGDCRKKVMGLYRLLGNKADVIKGFAKRCNENWQIAPRSEIGLYLGDIQDHIVTMTGNLTHYEKILARSHGNYLAQINIRMNERQEQTADVLGKLTVLGTIVLPMNIITGLWGMNVWVPGQNAEGDLTWFWCLTAGLLFFGLSCFMIAKVLYHIV